MQQSAKTETQRDQLANQIASAYGRAGLTIIPQTKTWKGRTVNTVRIELDHPPCDITQYMAVNKQWINIYKSKIIVSYPTLSKIGETLYVKSQKLPSPEIEKLCRKLYLTVFPPEEVEEECWFQS